MKEVYWIQLFETEEHNQLKEFIKEKEILLFNHQTVYLYRQWSTNEIYEFCIKYGHSVLKLEQMLGVEDLWHQKQAR